LLAVIVSSSVPADSLPDLSALFGARIQASPRFEAPYALGDFDGDGKPDALYLVTVLAESPQARLAGDVVVIDHLFGRGPLEARPETLALAIAMENGRRKFLLTGYQGDGVTGFFESPIWQDAPPPLRVEPHGSKVFEDFRGQEPGIRYDIIVVGTEAGIDTALYWTGRGFALFQPTEEP